MTCIVYLASPITFQEPTQPGLSRFDVLRLSLYSVNKHLRGLPVVIFHEDYTESHFKELRGILPSIVFEKINFSGGEDHFQYKKRSKNYMMMCRFFSGIMQSHPVVSRYNSYMRMDDDSFLISPVNINLSVMKRFDYVYRSTFVENHDQSSLFYFTKSFLQKRCLPIQTEKLKEVGFLRADGTYSGLAPYNNFHFCPLSFWKHPLIKEYVDLIEVKHGILKYMWLDANIHAMMIFMLAPVCGLKVSCQTNFGYRHNRHFSILGSKEIQYRGNVEFCPSMSEI